MSVIFPETEITGVLKLIKHEYDIVYRVHSKRNTRLMKLYSNMAVMSLSGWIEDGMKNMVNLSLKGLDADGQKRLLGKTGRVYGPSYIHFTNRLEVAYGSHGLKYIESCVGDTDKDVLTSLLANIKRYRGAAAHSYAITILRDPSGILSDANRIIPILKKYEVAARAYKKQHF